MNNTWDFRIVVNKKGVHSVHEVHYDPKNNAVIAWRKEPICIDVGIQVKYEVKNTQTLDKLVKDAGKISKELLTLQAMMEYIIEAYRRPFLQIEELKDKAIIATELQKG